MTDDELEKLAEQFGEWMGGERINDIPHYRLVVTNTAGFARAVAERAAREERDACEQTIDARATLLQAEYGGYLCQNAAINEAKLCLAAIRARGAGGSS